MGGVSKQGKQERFLEFGGNAVVLMAFQFNPTRPVRNEQAAQCGVLRAAAAQDQGIERLLRLDQLFISLSY